MPEVIRISDSDTLVPMANYPYAKWEYKDFNPIQSRLFDIYNKNCNVAVAASTAAGKTICCEMFMAYEIRKRKKKGIYIGPMKALCNEKQEDWSEDTYHFHDLKTFIATGDYRFTAKRLKEMEESQLVVMTPEMLASKCRNHKSDKSKFLYDVGVVIFDESHLLTVPSRGDHIEVALMKLAEINPDVRIVLLSATMPNVDEICGWVTNLTKRDTYFLESTYRPCPLNIHYETYYDGDKDYDSKEAQKISKACAMINYYKDDKFLIFAHTKRTGNLMVQSLKKQGVNAEFHNADLAGKKRKELENRFRTDKNFRVLVATSTVAWGVNTPARRVIILGVHRGLQEVENYDIGQMVGRAGRPKYDACGDAYILVPETEKKEWIAKLKKPTKIKSTLLNYVGNENNPHYKTLAFHIVAEIHQGNVNAKEPFQNWFRRSLAHHQDHAFDDEVISKTLGLLEQFKAIYVNPDDTYECTAIGRIASMFYYSPFDVSDLRRNFKALFDRNLENDDYAVSICLGDIDSHRWGIVNRYEREAIATYHSKISRMFGDNRFSDAAIKIGCVYFNMLKGRADVPHLGAMAGSLLVDLDRTMQVMNAIDSMSCKWEKYNWFRQLGLRIRYGVESDIVELCQIPNVGAARAKRLKARKINTVSEFTTYTAPALASIMKCSLKLAEQALDGARLVELKDAM